MNQLKPIPMVPARALNHDCDGSGCFQHLKAPRLRFFDDCFGGRRAMADIDGIIDNNGHMVMMEWKEIGTPLTTGQRITLTNFSANAPGHRQVGLVLWGNPMTMAIEQLQWFLEGRPLAVQATDTREVLGSLADWDRWSSAQPRRLAHA